jgi:vacuolar iron transporter family protein
MSSIKRYTENLIDERDSAALYKELSKQEANPIIAEVYSRLAATEAKHARSWEKKILESGGVPPEPRISFRTRALMALAKYFGVDFVLPSLVSFEKETSHDYAKQPEAAGMLAAERSHAILLQQLNRTQDGAGVEGAVLAKMEGRHRSAGGNALRAAVLGASDGLLSNFNLVMGVAGAEATSNNILLTGLAGLLAGAISMALGEWISVQSSRELYERQIQTEKEEIENDPAEEIEELILIYQARGLSEELARPLATKLLENPETALDTLARDELGIDPEELGGSAWEAALTSFLLFAVGAVIPVIPFFLMTGQAAVITSAGISAVGLFIIGGVTTLFTGRPVLYSGLRQVAFGLLAAATTYSIGRLIGISLT